MIRLLIGLLAALIATPAVAQDSASRALPVRSLRGCKAGRTFVTGCRTFAITEAAYLVRIPTSGDDSYREGRGATVDLGVIHNISPRVALGVTASAGLLNEIHVAVKPRVRLWLDPKVSLDLSPGIVLVGQPRYAAETSIMYQDKIGFSLQGYSIPDYRFENGSAVLRNRFDLFAGVRLGSTPGLVGIAGDALAFLLAISAYFIACSSNGCD